MVFSLFSFLFSLFFFLFSFLFFLFSFFFFLFSVPFNFCSVAGGGHSMPLHRGEIPVAVVAGAGGPRFGFVQQV